MIVIRSVTEFIQLRKQIPQQVGFVPTMGALHQGHLSLIDESLKNNDVTVVSIFVNPTQFNESTDFDSYPSQIDQDLQLLEDRSVDYVFLPDKEQLYPDNYKYKITENELSQRFCGAHRPGHFDGVLSIVMKLFNIVKPHNSYFGEKDYQQLSLIKSMVDAFFIDTTIVPVKTHREQNGLAMSSRNVLLEAKYKEAAPMFYQTLKQAKSADEALKELQTWADHVEYVEDFEGRRLGAIKLGNVRLIDNVEI